MPNKNFLLMSLEDTKIKKISNVISNDSCRKILDYLSTKEATESELAEKLQLPISTVHYNLQQLMETELISADEFHYSQKGKEVSHYRLANKYIIIAPKKTFGIKEKLKNILPVLLIAGGAALALQFTSKYFLQEARPEIMAAKTAAYGVAAPVAVSEAAPVASNAIQTAQPNIALWFLFGAVFALAIYLVINLLRKDAE